ncbi:hypothetical protein PVK64_09420 [Aliivibrio sp. S4TY2]|uniref:hypothetical protein n=1 Tax=unclassified Aliivibrio TaxID=2645654 RepID=UPI0023783E75|nr:MULTISPECIES: hypothetical protein [unclassified Aliivibrio]MDD9156406.1 hypothetical protein [Aliivibrio sp. S4TY2]MDD9162336.1 hypothetical protein [Aliivibrio sp. S4TY1]MDD9164114.1 hypothetical protein [Aliivibrio sp. S4MY2]MDD9167913.1 hypothetical protein [Aliivibrio sp. S4MY4]MDD9187422.1 hypothetical protein [Aliivibrio sp. S4MY3]
MNYFEYKTSLKYINKQINALSEFVSVNELWNYDSQLGDDIDIVDDKLDILWKDLHLWKARLELV